MTAMSESEQTMNLPTVDDDIRAIGVQLVEVFRRLDALEAKQQPEGELFPHLPRATTPCEQKPRSVSRATIVTIANSDSGFPTESLRTLSALETLAKLAGVEIVDTPTTTEPEG